MIFVLFLLSFHYTYKWTRFLKLTKTPSWTVLVWLREILLKIETSITKVAS